MRATTHLLALLVMITCPLACTSQAGRDPGGAGKTDPHAGDPAAAPQVALSRSAAPDHALPVNALACDLYGRLRSTPGNLICSPLSVSAAMGLTYAGAAGTTRDEMRGALHLPADDARAYEGYRTLFADLDRSAAAGGAHWTLANRLWVQKDFALLPGYLRTTRESFDSEAGELDFRRDPEPARATMNRWVEEKTERRIKDLFPAGSITPVTRLVLANAVYFKGLWQVQFDKEQTQPTPFHVTTSATKSVPMMHQTGAFGYARRDWGRVLEIPYKDEKIALVVLLPDQVDGLANLESHLQADSLRAWTSGLRQREVRLGLPRLKATSQLELNGALAALGMPSAFSDAADFSGMTGRRDLFISLVVHKALIEVNEEGTEAAAATGAVMELTAIADEPEQFLADRPFLFLIRDRASGCILFLGRVADPSS
jgi:serpin B